MLTAYEVQQVLIDFLNGAEPSIGGKEADDLREEFTKEIAVAKAKGMILDTVDLE
jgi:hypothetical protein